MQVLFTPRSANSKTGDVPTAWVGGNYEETVQSCKKSGCPLLQEKHGGKHGQVKKDLKLRPCYAHNGTASFALKSMFKAFEKGKDYSLATAIKKSVRSARIVRFTGVGDPSSISAKEAQSMVSQIHDAGMLVKGFTAGWRKAKHWKGLLMASTFTMKEADKAIEKGWRASVVLPADFVGFGAKKSAFTTPGGNHGVICPHQMGARVTCNSCRLCVAEKPGPIVGFLSHV